ncbi:MAG TPA: hypothetical protein VEB43_03205 [Anaeromyxobacter sp.]|nr:hypothetical protein [Anaeromyxobacter sp.]
MRRPATCACALVLATACASAGARGPGAQEYRFPRAFAASQVVAVNAGGERREFIASVRRSGAAHEVTLFDPVFAAPVLTARAEGRAVTEELLAPGPRAGDGVRLVKLLRDVFARRYAERGGEAEAGGWTGRVRLTGLAPEPGPCRFPAEIELAARGGAGSVRVRTLEAECE